MIRKYEPDLMQLVVLMPVYNDWESAVALIQEIDAALADSQIQLLIVIVDDGSSTQVHRGYFRKKLKMVSAIDVLRLRRNLGHQRAIAVGLTHIYKKVTCDAVLVMDSDGEDIPQDVPRLINAFCDSDGERIVFAKRTRRMETPLFKICYRCYQILHRVLTGIEVKVGNFSIIPFNCLSALVVSPELWNHYAAAAFKLHLPVALLDCSRGKRLFGASKMNFVSLVVHGLSAISVFGEIAGTRIFVAACGLTSLIIGASIILLAFHFFADITVPIWAGFSSVFVLVLLLFIFTVTFGFLLFVLMNRNMASFLPLRDTSYFLDDIRRIYRSDG